MPIRLYPWTKWFTFQEFTLVKGVDYVCSQSAIAQQVRNAANKRGLRVSLEERDRSLTVRVIRSEEEPK